MLVVWEKAEVDGGNISAGPWEPSRKPRAEFGKELFRGFQAGNPELSLKCFGGIPGVAQW